MATTVVGLFDDQDTAQSAVRDLLQSGFRRQDISLVAADPKGDLYRQHVDDEGNIAGEGAATGLTSGAVVGGLLGLLIGAGLIFVPAGVVAAGPIAGLIAGGAAGAATGGLLGGLIGLGIPKDEADVYAESVRRGGTLVTVRVDENRADEAHQILDRDGAVNIEDRRESYRSEGWSGYDPNAAPYSPSTAIDPTFAGTSIPPVVPTSTSDDLTGDDAGRRARVRSYSASGGAYSPSTSDDDTFYRSHYQSNYGATGSMYDEYEPAYGYGARTGSDSRYRDRSFAEIEADLRNEYESNYPGKYDSHRTAIQGAFDRSRTRGSGAYADTPSGERHDDRTITEKIGDAINGNDRR